MSFLFFQLTAFLFLFFQLIVFLFLFFTRIRPLIKCPMMKENQCYPLMVLLYKVYFVLILSYATLGSIPLPFF